MVMTLNEVDLEREAGNLLLSPSGCAHAIFGLSHQCHTHDRLKEELSKSLSELRAQVQAGNDDLEEEYNLLKEKFNQLRSEVKDQDPPKNEAWLPFQFGGETFLLEPQQRSNTTYSWLDLYTPFEFKNGKFSFRKGDPENGISDEKLNKFLDELSFNPKTIDELRYGGETIFEEHHVKVIEYIDDPIEWPYFTLHKLEFDGSESNAARYELQPPRGSFIQVATLKGQAKLIQQGKVVAQTHPGSPVFIPASLKDNIEIVAHEFTEIVFMSVPTPWSMSSQLAYANCDSNSIPSV